jgi:hypothetical protein
MSCSQFELGWLAGIIDGEGSISIVKRGPTYVPQVKMANTSKKLVDKYCEILDKLDISYHCYGKQKEGNRKYQWEVSVDGRPRVFKFVSLLQDLLVSKQRQAETVLEWIESRGLDLRGPYTEQQLQLINNIKQLNGRGREFSEA